MPRMKAIAWLWAVILWMLLTRAMAQEPPVALVQDIVWNIGQEAMFSSQFGIRPNKLFNNIPSNATFIGTLRTVTVCL